MYVAELTKGFDMFSFLPKNFIFVALYDYSTNFLDVDPKDFSCLLDLSKVTRFSVFYFHDMCFVECYVYLERFLARGEDFINTPYAFVVKEV